ncbi:MAG TPA: SDR family oxidoreductase [Verrucomicrobiae bacterium]|jgi:NAD(P)-dependent dehydrogenase (short-subunit alcohol dehydrogenase family)
MKLQNKIAVITGGNSGIGWAAAQEFKAQGARVIIIGRNAEAVVQAAKELGGDTLGVTADVSRVADIDRAFQTIGKATERMDILFVNAGIAKFAPLADSTEALFDEMTDTNLKGAYFTVQRALPLLSEGASVIFTSSAVVHFGMSGASVYAAGKGALNSLVKTLALELASRKIRVNVVSPGPIATPIFGKMGLSEEEMDKVSAGILAQVPLGRFGEAAEIARCVAFLASSESSYVSGTELVVDGAMSQK